MGLEIVKLGERTEGASYRIWIGKATKSVSPFVPKKSPKHAMW